MLQLDQPSADGGKTLCATRERCYQSRGAEQLTGQHGEGHVRLIADAPSKDTPLDRQLSEMAADRRKRASLPHSAIPQPQHFAPEGRDSRAAITRQ